MYGTKKERVMVRRIFGCVIFLMSIAVFRVIGMTPSEAKGADKTFTIASCNVLYHSYYAGFYRQNDIKKISKGIEDLRAQGINFMSEVDKIKAIKAEVIPIGTRRAFFRDAFNDVQEFKGADILCFQEWPYKDPEPFKNRVEVSTFGFEPTAYKFFDLDSWKYRLDGTRIGCKISLVSQVSEPYGEGFKQLDSKGVLQPGNKGFCFIKFKFAGTDIGIITGHFGFGDELLKTHLTNITNYIAWKSGLKKWIICGDFNSDKNYQIIQESFKPSDGWKEIQDWEANELTHRTGEDEYKDYDYMIYKGVELNEKPSIFPKSLDQLLSHNTNQSSNPPRYFSDHAILRATFGISKIAFAYDPQQKCMVLILKKQMYRNKATTLFLKDIDEKFKLIGAPIQLLSGDFILQQVAFDEKQLEDSPTNPYRTVSINNLDKDDEKDWLGDIAFLLNDNKTELKSILNGVLASMPIPLSKIPTSTPPSTPTPLPTIETKEPAATALQTALTALKRKLEDLARVLAPATAGRR